MNTILDNLLSENLIRPTIAVYVPPVDRTPEYISSKKNSFTSFIIDEVMPWVDSKYRTKTDASERMTIGSSAGGNISLWLAMNYPEEFGNVGPFSPFIDDDIQNQFANNDRLDIRIFMTHGKYDLLTAIQNSVNSFLPILEEKEYDYSYGEYPEGHSWGFWRGYIDEALIFAFPGSATDIQTEEIVPESFTLYQNYPNPFNPTTTIEYSLPVNSKQYSVGSRKSTDDRKQNSEKNTQSTNQPISQSNEELVTLNVFDILGRHVATLVNKQQRPGLYQVKFDADNLTSGVYFYKLVVNGLHSQSMKMVLIR